MPIKQLARHSAAYAIARAVPSVLTFFTLALYTRWLDPQQFGLYALVVAAVGLCRVVFFHWIRLGLLRLLPAHTDTRAIFLSTVGTAYLVSCCVGLLLAGPLFPMGKEPILVVLGVLLFWSYGWLDMNLDLLRSDFRAMQYGFLLTWRTAWSLIIGAVLIREGWGAKGALLGTLAGTVLPGPGTRLLFAQWNVVRARLISRTLLRELAVFGLPPTMAVAFTFVVSTSDRFFLAVLRGTDAAGLYAAAYDLAQNSIGGLLLPISLASFPLAVRALERRGFPAAIREMEMNFVALTVIGVPAVIGLAVLAKNVAHVLLGENFRATGEQIVPWVVFAEFLGTLIGVYFNRAFQLSKRTGKQIQPYAVAALVNVILNWLWIPRWGVMGAAYSTTVAYLVAIGLSYLVGRRVFPIPVPPRPLVKVVIAGAIMAVFLVPTRLQLGVGWLAVQVCIGALAFTAALSILTREWTPYRIFRSLITDGASVDI